ncbi:hypothetical protein ACFU53_11105 [Streptomyces sp. NPDC057474]|uniref:hypothetical protein n=1 Tax=Streptomyces sp. NPDC057474 TaxID=3346144 RepID=UPI0036853568
MAGADVVGGDLDDPTSLRKAMRIRAFDEQLTQMVTFCNERPAGLPDVSALREHPPGLMSLGTWLRSTGWKP